ncbi:hypothetical protein [Dysgonomonas termitidis]|uniref:Uncharacterized protein n=1 Tax=Dysgonomonas termitidis TaxID=1516126 RepID=A0ABV9KY52_9BACT
MAKYEAKTDGRNIGNLYCGNHEVPSEKRTYRKGDERAGFFPRRKGGHKKKKSMTTEKKSVRSVRF